MTADDSHAIEFDNAPILTIKRSGEELGAVVVHKSESELEGLARTDSMARLALEIVRAQNRLAAIRRIANGDWGINSKLAMEEIDRQASWGKA